MSKKILRFTASWCAPCKMLAKNLETIQLDYPVDVIDIDEHSDIANRYAIRGVPTLVMLDDGYEVSRVVGMKTVPQLQEWVDMASKMNS